MSSPLIPSTDAEKSTSSIGVLVVDDQVAVREGLRRLIACAPLTLRYVITAANSTEAQEIAIRLRPDVVVLDVDLAGEDGLALIPQFAQSAGVLVLTSHGDPTTREHAARLGANAFIEKHQPAADLLSAIASICHLSTQAREKAPAAPGTSPPMVLAPSSDAQTTRRT